MLGEVRTVEEGSMAGGAVESVIPTAAAVVSEQAGDSDVGAADTSTAVFVLGTHSYRDREVARMRDPGFPRVGTAIQPTPATAGPARLDRPA
jgi:hypothetical protein